MNTKTILDTIMRRLGNRKETTLRTQCLAELNTVITTLESGPFLPWFLEAEAEILTVIGQNYVDLPADFLQEYEEGMPYLKDATDHLVKGSYEDFQQLYRNVTTTSCPVHYAVYGEKLYLGPTPDKVYTLVLPYLTRSAALADDTAAASRWAKYAPELLISMTGELMAEFHLQNEKLAARFRAKFAFVRQELFRAHEMRKHTNHDYTLERVD